MQQATVIGDREQGKQAPPTAKRSRIAPIVPAVIAVNMESKSSASSRSADSAANAGFAANAGAHGTTVVLTALFASLPVRRARLSPVSEGAAVRAVVAAFALARPHVRFTLRERGTNAGSTQTYYTNSSNALDDNVSQCSIPSANSFSQDTDASSSSSASASAVRRPSAATRVRERALSSLSGGANGSANRAEAVTDAEAGRWCLSAGSPWNSNNTGTWKNTCSNSSSCDVSQATCERPCNVEHECCYFAPPAPILPTEGADATVATAAGGTGRAKAKAKAGGSAGVGNVVFATYPTRAFCSQAHRCSQSLPSPLAHPRSQIPDAHLQRLVARLRSLSCQEWGVRVLTTIAAHALNTALSAPAGINNVVSRNVTAAHCLKVFSTTYLSSNGGARFVATSLAAALPQSPWTACGLTYPALLRAVLTVTGDAPPRPRSLQRSSSSGQAQGDCELWHEPCSASSCSECGDSSNTDSDSNADDNANNGGIDSARPESSSQKQLQSQRSVPPLGASIAATLIPFGLSLTAADAAAAVSSVLGAAVGVRGVGDAAVARAKLMAAAGRDCELYTRDRSNNACPQSYGCSQACECSQAPKAMSDDEGLASISRNDYYANNSQDNKRASMSNSIHSSVSTSTAHLSTFLAPAVWSIVGAIAPPLPATDSPATLPSRGHQHVFITTTAAPASQPAPGRAAEVCGLGRPVAAPAVVTNAVEAVWQWAFGLLPAVTDAGRVAKARARAGRRELRRERRAEAAAAAGRERAQESAKQGKAVRRRVDGGFVFEDHRHDKSDDDEGETGASSTDDDDDVGSGGSQLRDTFDDNNNDKHNSNTKTGSSTHTGNPSLNRKGRRASPATSAVTATATTNASAATAAAMRRSAHSQTQRLAHRGRQYPAFFLYISPPPGTVDVLYDPSKRAVGMVESVVPVPACENNVFMHGSGAPLRGHSDSNSQSQSRSVASHSPLQQSSMVLLPTWQMPTRVTVGGWAQAAYLSALAVRTALIATYPTLAAAADKCPLPAPAVASFAPPAPSRSRNSGDSNGRGGSNGVAGQGQVVTLPRGRLAFPRDPNQLLQSLTQSRPLPDLDSDPKTSSCTCTCQCVCASTLSTALAFARALTYTPVDAATQEISATPAMLASAALLSAAQANATATAATSAPKSGLTFSLDPDTWAALVGARSRLRRLRLSAAATYAAVGYPSPLDLKDWGDAAVDTTSLQLDDSARVQTQPQAQSQPQSQTQQACGAFSLTRVQLHAQANAQTQAQLLQSLEMMRSPRPPTPSHSQERVDEDVTMSAAEAASALMMDGRGNFLNNNNNNAVSCAGDDADMVAATAVLMTDTVLLTPPQHGLAPAPPPAPAPALDSARNTPGARVSVPVVLPAHTAPTIPRRLPLSALSHRPAPAQVLTSPAKLGLASPSITSPVSAGVASAGPADGNSAATVAAPMTATGDGSQYWGAAGSTVPGALYRKKSQRSSLTALAANPPQVSTATSATATGSTTAGERDPGSALASVLAFSTHADTTAVYANKADETQKHQQQQQQSKQAGWLSSSSSSSTTSSSSSASSVLLSLSSPLSLLLSGTAAAAGQSFSASVAAATGYTSLAAAEVGVRVPAFQSGSERVLAQPGFVSAIPAAPLSGSGSSGPATDTAHLSHSTARGVESSVVVDGVSRIAWGVATGDSIAKLRAAAALAVATQDQVRAQSHSARAQSSSDADTNDTTNANTSHQDSVVCIDDVSTAAPRAFASGGVWSGVASATNAAQTGRRKHGADGSSGGSGEGGDAETDKRALVAAATELALDCSNDRAPQQQLSAAAALSAFVGRVTARAKANAAAEAAAAAAAGVGSLARVSTSTGTSVGNSSTSAGAPAHSDTTLLTRVNVSCGDEIVSSRGRVWEYGSHDDNFDDGDNLSQINTSADQTSAVAPSSQPWIVSLSPAQRDAAEAAAAVAEAGFSLGLALNLNGGTAHSYSGSTGLSTIASAGELSSLGVGGTGGGGIGVGVRLGAAARGGAHVPARVTRHALLEARVLAQIDCRFVLCTAPLVPATAAVITAAKTNTTSDTDETDDDMSTTDGGNKGDCEQCATTQSERGHDACCHSKHRFNDDDDDDNNNDNCYAGVDTCDESLSTTCSRNLRNNGDNDDDILLSRSASAATGLLTEESTQAVSTSATETALSTQTHASTVRHTSQPAESYPTVNVVGKKSTVVAVSRPPRKGVMVFMLDQHAADERIQVRSPIHFLKLALRMWCHFICL